MSLLSHTDRTLASHLNSCDAIAKQLLEQKHLGTSFYAKEVLEQWRSVLIWLHDFGKSSAYFQHRIIEACEQENPSFAQENAAYIQGFRSTQNGIEAALKQQASLGNHAALGSYLTYGIAPQPDPIVGFILQHIIRRHHGNLMDYKTSTFMLLKETISVLQQQFEHCNLVLFNNISPILFPSISTSIWKSGIQYFKDGLSISDVIDDLEDIPNIRYFFLQHFLFSLLLAADKGDVMVSNKDIIKANQFIPSKIIDVYKDKQFGHLNPKPIDLKREQAYQAIAQNVLRYQSHSFFSITLPTGMGKTFSAYHAALLLQNQLKEVPYRIIYCLPFTSIIDQNEQVLSDILATNGLANDLIGKNHYLAAIKDRYRMEELLYQEGEYLTEGWEQELIVTTFVQLLESIFTNKNKRLRKFHNMANAIILLDEVQNIPAKYYNLIEFTFQKMADFFNTKFIFITATQPILFKDQDSIIELTDPSRVKTRQYFEELDRISLDTSLLLEGRLEEEQIIELLTDDVDQHPEQSFLIICNTIKQSQTIFKKLKATNFEATQFYYLSSSILPIFRKELIKTIKENTINGIRQIVVSTQVVEAGVDIDLDIVYRDFAPMDSINQSAGRCNRNGLKGRGIVKLFDSGKGRFIYDETLLHITRNVLQHHPSMIAESSFYDLNLAYFEAVKTHVQDDHPASQELIRYMEHLQLEKLANKFQLIPQDDRNYNVYIPFNEEAEQVWEDFQRCHQIDDIFERKTAIKKLKPRLLQFVTRFPKYAYNPPPDQKDYAIIFEPDWQTHYDLQTGFIPLDEQKSVAFF